MTLPSYYANLWKGTRRMEDLLLKFGVVAGIIMVIKLMFDFLKPILVARQQGQSDRSNETQVLPAIHSALDTDAITKINETYDVCRDIVKMTRELKEEHKLNKILLEAIAKDSDAVLKLAEESQKLHERCDEDGVQVWHIPASMRRAIAQLAESVKQLVRTLDDDA